MFTLVIFSATELVSESNGTSLEWGWPGLDFDMYQTSFGGGRTLTSKWWWGVRRKRVGRGQGERADLVTPPFTPFPSLPVDVVSCDIIFKKPWRFPFFSRTAPIWMAGVSKYFVDESGKVIKHVIDPLPEKAWNPLIWASRHKLPFFVVSHPNCVNLLSNLWLTESWPVPSVEINLQWLHIWKTFLGLLEVNTTYPK